MNELFETIWRSYGLYQHHIDYLNKIDENNNVALRKSIDRLINEDTIKSKHRLISSFSNSLVIIALGLLFFFFGYASADIIVKGFSILFGLFLVFFGLTYGVMSYKIR